MTAYTARRVIIWDRQLETPRQMGKLQWLRTLVQRPLLS